MGKSKEEGEKIMDYKSFPAFIMDIPELGKQEAVKTCPVCGGNGLHIFRVEILMGERAVIFKADEGIGIEKVQNNTSRGTVVRLYYSCEDAGDSYHGFLQEISFHKGTVTEAVIPLYVGKDNWWRDIWRN
jgi:hypothetical protein